LIHFYKSCCPVLQIEKKREDIEVAPQTLE